MATTVPTEVCAMAPNSSDDATVVTASDPRMPPISDTTQLTTRLAIPPRPMISPASTKNGTASSGKLSRLPNIAVCIASVGTWATNTIAAVAVSVSTTKIGSPRMSRSAGRMK